MRKLDWGRTPLNRPRFSLLVGVVLLFASLACQGGKVICRNSSEAGSGGAGKITLAWDSNSEPKLAGYRIYYGTSPGKYSHCVDIGKGTEPSPGTTRHILTGLDRGTTYFIAVLAYSNYGGFFRQSELSNEVRAVAK